MSLGPLSSSDEYSTPDRLFQRLDERYSFTLDVAAASWNAKCAHYFDKRTNGLRQRWTGRFFMNMPFSRGNPERWMKKARSEVETGHAELGACVCPAYHSEGWWDRHVEAPAGRQLSVRRYQDDLGTHIVTQYQRLGVEIIYLRGRQSFTERGGKKGNARYSTAIVVFSRPDVRGSRA